MYSDLGLKGGIHYVPYDGTIKDLTKKIKYYQVHPDELEKIAAAGYRFVLKHFQPDRVIKNFLKTIEIL
jgi:spore maturation protein CgeB